MSTKQIQPRSRRKPGFTDPLPSRLQGGSRLSPGLRVGWYRVQASPALLILLVLLTIAACTGVGYQPPSTDQSGPVHGESGGGSGGGSM